MQVVAIRRRGRKGDLVLGMAAEHAIFKLFHASL
jgi:hypothetical protein